MTCTSLFLAVASLLLPRVRLKFVLELRPVCLVEFLAVLCEHSTSRPPHSLLNRLSPVPSRLSVSLCATRSTLPFTRSVASPSPDIYVPSTWFPASSCVARLAFPSRPLLCPFPTRVFANSAPFPVSLHSVRPSFPPRPSRFPFYRLSSCFIASLPVESHVA